MSRLTGGAMDSFGDNKIARLLRLKRYERPPPDYFENFLHEFHRRQRERDALVRQPLWRICVECAEGFARRLNIRSLATAGIAVMVAFAAVVSLRLYQQPDTTQFAVQNSAPVPTRSPTTDRELDSTFPEFPPAFDAQPAVLRGNSRDIRMLPLLPARRRPHVIRSDEFVPLKLQWESLDDQPVLEK